MNGTVALSVEQCDGRFHLRHADAKFLSDACGDRCHRQRRRRSLRGTTRACVSALFERRRSARSRAALSALVMSACESFTSPLRAFLVDRLYGRTDDPLITCSIVFSEMRPPLADVDHLPAALGASHARSTPSTTLAT
jgi:hypothetical protein